MKKLVCVEPGRFAYEDVDIPTPGKGESLLRIRKIGICGTDIHAFAGRQPFFSYPRVLGHEVAADYVEGDAAGFVPGDKVTVIPYFTEGKDIASRMGKPNCTNDMRVLGVHIDGAMAEYVVVPSHALRKEEGLDYDDLVLVEPLSIGAHGIQRGGVIPEEFVLVIGAGPIGLGIIALANIAGGKVIALDVDDIRLAYAKALGASYTISALDADVHAQLANITNGDMPTLLFDATGNTAAINNAFQYMAHGARYVLVGLQKEEIHFSHPEFHKREGTLMSSRNALANDFEYVMQHLQDKSLDAAQFITRRVNFTNAAELFSDPSKPLLSGIKTIIEFN
ncbi:zinc-binding alcohol dehydrogenase family protein [Sphingobacterium corticibacterium]|uniref:Zinc-binding alcohol dehydrogenase family protein n=1 Tax=Sphingobacterium corticibacterium TaxID=2484746 RepID=A0A4Q6XJY4_9SPHI|nr:zinc-binding alcohol dehydrogenase family protein [Sphingobacterium corticibacterium]RZF60390.1 zinc-binding alcohol dehydrogenase family protein [Sphingobacterium corticibacterium]